MKLTQAWGLSSLHPKMHHRFEGAFKIKSGNTERLELRMWYEDRDSRDNQMTERLACRLLHSVLYGRNRLRKEKESLIEEAFSSRSLSEIRGIFFKVDQKALASAEPESTTRSSSEKNLELEERTTLRVHWKREEKVIPYLSWSLTRSDYKRLEKRFAQLRNPSFEEFQRSECGELVSLIPTLKSIN